MSDKGHRCSSSQEGLCGGSAFADYLGVVIVCQRTQGLFFLWLAHSLMLLRFRFVLKRLERRTIDVAVVA